MLSFKNDYVIFHCMSIIIHHCDKKKKKERKKGIGILIGYKLLRTGKSIRRPFHLQQTDVAEPGRQMKAQAIPGVLGFMLSHLWCIWRVT